jgi:hypothetical protein
MSLEHDLKRALRRESPAPGFSARVLARIDEAEPPRTTWWRAAAASVTLAVLLGGYGTHKAIEYRRGERAREQVLEAMRIAGQKMSYAREEVRQIGTHDGKE